MRARSAAPEGGTSGHGFSNGNGAILTLGLPARITARLAAEGVRSLVDWRALGRKRLAIFGITPSVIKQLDDLAKVQP